MDYTKLFYWLTVADNARGLFTGLGVFFTVIFIIATIVNGVQAAENNEEVDSKIRMHARKWQYTGIFPATIFWLLLVFTPSKRDSLLIIAGGETINFLATDESAKQIPHELSNFVLTELKNMAKEVEVDLNITSQKEKLIESAKQMTTEQLIEELKTNKELKDLILNEN